MKVTPLFLILLFTFSFSWPKNITAHSRDPLATTANWPADSTVSVYFVSGVFTNAQTRIICETLDAWTETGKGRNSALRFVYAGQTRGLIDCQGCLTVSRHQAYVGKPKRVSFEAIRYDEKGQLISAWVAFDNAVTNTQVLRELLLEVLDHRAGNPRQEQ